MKINSNLIRSICLQLQVGVKLSEIGFVQNSFDLIHKFAIWLIQKVKNVFYVAIGLGKEYYHLENAGHTIQ